MVRIIGFVAFGALHEDLDFAGVVADANESDAAERTEGGDAADESDSFRGFDFGGFGDFGCGFVLKRGSESDGVFENFGDFVCARSLRWIGIDSLFAEPVKFFQSFVSIVSKSYHVNIIPYTGVF